MKRLVYLDNAASSFPKPKAVAKAVANTIENVGANPGRSGHVLGVKASRIVFEARMAVAALFNLPNPERIVFTKNATEGINLALKGLLKRGDKVAVSRIEHNAVIRPLAALKKRGVKVDYAPVTENGTPDSRALPDVRLLVTVAGGNVTGAMADIGALSAACRKKGVWFMVDAAQTGGSAPLDGSKMDVLACTGHKGLLGPQGTGFVWFAPGVSPAPLIEGGTGSDSESKEMPAFWPDRHEGGTLNTPGIAGLRAGVDYLIRRSVAAVREKEVELCRMIMERLGNDPRMILYSPIEPERRASLVSFNIRGADPGEVGALLDRHGVASRAGLHCAPEAHRFLGSFPEGTVRVSPGALTAKKDVLRFFDALDRVVRDL